MFGSKQFGTANPFGQQQQQTAFGKPASNAFGTPAFGQNTSIFGATQPATVFGQTAPVFGTGAGAAFGTAAPQPGFGTFGQTQQPTTSLFGQTSNAPANTSSMFGQPSTSGFGVKPSFGGGFNSTQPAPLFGQTATSNTGTGFGTFGSPATSAFGQTQAGSNGTAIAKFQPHPGTDTLLKNGQATNVNTRQHCITAIKEYESKSLEELRLEDYLANRKGPQGGTQPSTGLFGSNAPSTGLFGAPSSQSQSTGLFGQPATNTLGSGFGATNTAFGQQQQQQQQQQQPQQPSAFGQAAQQSLFAKPANSFGQPTAAFGQPAPNNSANLFGKTFGAPATTATGFGGFGNTNTNASPFGTKPFGQSTGGLFGQTTPATSGSTFGQTGGFGTFGQNTATSQPAPLFGSNNNNTAGGNFFSGLTASSANTGFGGFGTATNTAVGGGLFGQKTTGFSTAPAFGATATTTGFTLGSFTNPSTSTGFGTFGQNNAFNKPAIPSFTGFGTQSTLPTLGTGTGLGSNFMGFGANPANQQPQPTTVPIHQRILSLATSPYGDNPIFKDLKPLGGLNEEALKPTNPAAQKAILESSSRQYKISSKVNNGIKVKPVGSNLSKKSLFGGLEEFDSSVEESFSLKPNAKRLLIKAKPSNSSSQSPKASQNAELRDQNQQKSQSERLEKENIPQATESDNSRRVSWLHSNLNKLAHQNHNVSDMGLNNTIQDFGSSSKAKFLSEKATDLINSSVHDETSSHGETEQDDSLLSHRSFYEDTSGELSAANNETNAAGVILTRPGYYTIPPLNKLVDYMTEDGSCIVPNFTIGRKGYGNVYFGEPIDVAGLNLDELVHFRNKEIIIYPDDDSKPPIGTELNRKAQVTLDQVWPHDKTLHASITDKARLEEMDYEGKLRDVCAKHDTRFVEYRPETGSWVFKVDHFSKYGLTDSDEEDSSAAAKKLKPNVPTNKETPGKQTGAIAKVLRRQTESHQILNSQGRSANVNKEMDISFSGSEVDPTILHHRQLTHPVSPSTELAMDMGTDSHKLQLMKASFFHDGECDDRSVTFERFGGRDSPDQIVPTKRPLSFTPSSHSLLLKDVSSTTSSSSNDAPMLSPAPHNISEVEKKRVGRSQKDLVANVPFKQTNLIVKPKTAVLKTCTLNIPLSKSIISLQLDKKIAADVALQHARRFKVGWNHQNSLTVLSTVNKNVKLKKVCDINEMSTLFNGRSSGDYSQKIVNRISLSSCKHTSSTAFEASIIKHLECQLKYDVKTSIDNNSCPFYISGGKADALQEHAELANKIASFGDYDQFCAKVWSLCVSLWGEQEYLEGIPENEHMAIILRRELLSQWLEIEIEKTLGKKQTSAGYLEDIFKLLISHKIKDACDLAFNNNDINLSLLLAQAEGNKIVRTLIKMQLDSWRSSEADKFIAVNRLKALMIVGGIPSFESSLGTINIYEDTDWLQALAINVWYMCSPTASITDGLLRYENAVNIDAPPPLPHYCDEYNIQSEQASQIQDLRFHILKLYSKRSHPLEALLNPATHTPDLLDFRMSWLLFEVLNSLGYHHCSEQAEANLHVSFASQLESYGLWQWSIFILMHLRNQARRELAIQELLYRYIDLSQDSEYLKKESFLINQLGIPEMWIYWAKAVRAGVMKNYKAQAEYLLQAKQWSAAHEVIMTHIAPNAIVNENIQYIKDLLDRFEEPQQISNWTNQGMILLDYLDISAKFEMLKTIHDKDIETRWEGLKPQLSELCSRINLFPCPTAKHRLCQSEIAQGLAILVNGIDIINPEINPCLLVKTALEKLPLPEEYAKQKIRALLDNSYLYNMLQADENE